MALNPISYTEKVSRSFLRYQLTAYPFADPGLNAQMRSLLSLDETRNSPLIQGPYISLSRSFQQGSSVEQLIAEGIFHPHMRQRIPANITHVYGHQDAAIRAIHAGKTTLVSTGTGSGKTECFLYPIISKCLELRDQSAAPGICAVIVYPMNALAEDQLGRLRGLLAGTGISFGMYVGKTPEKESQVTGIRLAHGASRAEYEARVAQLKEQRSPLVVHPSEEVCSREAMRRAGGQPRILLTNVKQLELLLTRQRDVELFTEPRLDFLVFDEAHTFTGANGAETACLIRRLRNFCGRSAQETVCIATSATIVDPGNPHAARDFAARFFGVGDAFIETVNEAYEADSWSEPRHLPKAPSDPGKALQACVLAVDAADPDGAVRVAYRLLCGEQLPVGNWQEALHTALSQNDLLRGLSQLLERPCGLDALPERLGTEIGRAVTEEEILAWLTLGAAARKEERSLVRPVVHAFIQGISGAVVSFPPGASGPRLWLAAEDELNQSQDGDSAHFPISTCTTCGQHYFETSLADFAFTGRAPEGGLASGNSHYWERQPKEQGGTRVLLLDHLVGNPDDEDLEEEDKVHPLYFCRVCGTAHPQVVPHCLGCGQAGEMVRLHAVRQKEDRVGSLTSCVSCRATGRPMGGSYREPARPVRATQVADVHVLAQDLVNYAERKRLLVFSDNRQDAAFQAGWMKDRARRFRLRALMAEAMRNGPVSIGDMTHYVSDVLDRDDSLSRMLIPEVWMVKRKEGSGGGHAQERLKYLRIQVLREVAMGSRQALGLEPWGRMKVEYEGLHESLPWIRAQSQQLGIPPEDLFNGVASVLDYLRRKRVLWDGEFQLFTRMWMDGDREIQSGYIPQLGHPEGTKLRKGVDEKYVSQWLSIKGDTTLKQLARKWEVPAAEIDTFLEGLFQFLADPARPFLIHVTLRGTRDNPLPNVTEVFQVNGDLVRMHATTGVYVCNACRRRTPRKAPYLRCTAWRCSGTLVHQVEDRDNYNLWVLDNHYEMLRPEEHTAMVPTEDRERYENIFKGESDTLNTLVCTPTLELGVDIGQLDTVLMRNVPPLPANYWQRAGRAGRRHRMAVDLTYCRTTSHDRAYFRDPLKLLMGRVDPPAFNLRNEVMVSKHVHATVLTRLHQYTRDAQLTELERTRIEAILRRCLPDQVRHYLFDPDGRVRTTPFDFVDLEVLVHAHEADLNTYVLAAFSQGWPDADSIVVSSEALGAHVNGFVDGLRLVVRRLQRRLNWAIDQIRRLNVVRESQGTLEPEDDYLFRRCDQMVKRLKGQANRDRKEAEGFDDTNTFGVLSAEGFLPGYGLEIGSILGTAILPHWRVSSVSEISLPRPPSVALREYVPGNLIYTNGNKFVARRFHRQADEHQQEVPTFEFSQSRSAVLPVHGMNPGSRMGAVFIQAISVCDVELVHQSHISDEEDFRFQMGVSIHGLQRHQHNGGRAYQWGSQPVQHRRGERFRLVNVGANAALKRPEPEYGYPVCMVCGQSMSPFSSAEALRKFREAHQERCGRALTNVGFYADVVADALVLTGLADQKSAYSLLETLRIAGTQVLDMHMEDLQVLVIGHVDRDEVTAILWDPMPGGSGLLDQYCERFAEIHVAALNVVEHCPAACDTACVDCLQTFRNGFYHRHLDRHVAAQLLQTWGTALAFLHDIPVLQPQGTEERSGEPVNDAERTLRELLRLAGFADGIRGEQIRLGNALGTTTPDIVYRLPGHVEDEGIAVYLDGMSAQLHGDPARAEQDRRIRDWLSNQGWEMISITATELSDMGAMTRYFRRLARLLREDEIVERMRSETPWWEVPASDDGGVVLEFVVPTAAERYVSAVPYIPLQAAAGGFGEAQHIVDGEWDWVRYTGSRRLAPGMFVTQVVGKSMEPLIPDGSFCLFNAGSIEGTRQGKVVLVMMRDALDAETGQRFTVKEYASEKGASEDGGWRHERVVLKPRNRGFEALVFEGEGLVTVLAEFLGVV